VSGELKEGAARHAPALGWYLETVSDEAGTLRRVNIRTLPFRVGRRQGLELVLPAESVSKLHAEIYARGQDLRLRDLGSRNGSFVNRALVEDAALLDVPARLAKRLLTLGTLHGQRGKAGITLRISQEDLATFLGVSRQVVNQHLQSWKAQGWVELGRGSVTVRNEEALRKSSAAR